MNSSQDRLSAIDESVHMMKKQDGEGQKNSAATGVKFGKKVQYY